MPGLSLNTKIQHSQEQLLLQKQIASFNCLAKSAEDLRKDIQAAAEENPALKVVSYNFGDSGFSETKNPDREKAEQHQAMLNMQEDTRKSLQAELLLQFDVLKVSKTEKELAELIVYNLDSYGHFREAPVTLLDKKNPLHTQALLNKCISILQTLEPVGTCTKNTEESLYVQAKNSEHPNELALFILNGHMEKILKSNDINSIKRKLKEYRASLLKTLEAPDKKLLELLDVENSDVEKALNFIKTLDPFPARDYSVDIFQTHLVSADIIVRPTENLETEDFEKGIVSLGSKSFKVELSENTAPVVEINKKYLDFSKKKTLVPEEKVKAEQNIEKVKALIEQLEFRKNILKSAAFRIIKEQKEFFLSGPGNLKPFTQKQLAEYLGVHESTISRMANSKYIQCESGMFAIKHFFNSGLKNGISRDQVEFEIKKILQQNKNQHKKLSAQKICDMLNQKGIPIARRTVAKYLSGIWVK